MLFSYLTSPGSTCRGIRPPQAVPWLFVHVDKRSAVVELEREPL